MGDNNILTFLCYWLDKKITTLKTAFWAIFSIRNCKVSQLIDFFTGLKTLQSN